MKRSILFALRLMIVAALLAVVTGRAQADGGIIVTTFTDENGNGANCSLREAVIAVNTGGPFGGCPSGAGVNQILLPSADGEYRIDITGDKEDQGRTGDIDIRRSLQIIGSGKGTLVYGPPTMGDRIFHVITPAGAPMTYVTMTSFEIKGGLSTEGTGGGGVLNDKATLRLNHMKITANKSTSVGGGVTNNRNSVLVVDRSVFNSNNAGSGGGIHNAGKLTVSNSLFSANNASITGGAVDHDNSAMNEVTAEIINSTIGFNSSLNDTQGEGGGGLVVSQGRMTVTNVTIAGNIGTGVLVSNYGSLVIRNSIIAGHASSNNCERFGSGVIDSFGYNLIDKYDNTDPDECVFAGSGDIINQNPMLSNTLTVNESPDGVFVFESQDSPAVDAIPLNNPYAPKYDQLKHGRPADGDQNSNAGYDIGAYELGGFMNSLFLPHIRR